jgi:hypothetical protein
MAKPLQDSSWRSITCVCILFPCTRVLLTFLPPRRQLISGIVHVVLTLPTGAGEAYESSTRLLQTLLARVQEDVVALNAERDCMRLPPYPLLHTAWTLRECRAATARSYTSLTWLSPAIQT